MRITFVLPGVVLEPSGGAKIVYEYANHLSAKGHCVNVVHPRTWIPLGGTSQALKSAIWPHFIRHKAGGPIPWMQVDKRVRQLIVPDLRERYLPDADVVIATFFRTAPPVMMLPASKGRKFYFIQHFEDWAGTTEEVEATWRLPMQKIVISLFLLDIAARLGVDRLTRHIPNAMDLATFRIVEPISTRRRRIIMLANRTPFKGLKEGLEALRILRNAHPDIEACCFGVEQHVDALPEWVGYVCRPSPEQLREIYNTGSVFIQPSLSEGWGLTATESMACGCALVSTDCGGSKDYAVDGLTALVVPPGNGPALAKAVERLLGDDALRIQLAEAGHSHVQQYNWNRSVELLEAALAVDPAHFP